MNTKEKRLLLVMPPQPALMNGVAEGFISLANFDEATIPRLQAEILDLSVQSYDSA